MNCRFLLAVLLQYQLLLFCFASANSYESDDIDNADRQLDLATEDHTLQLRLGTGHGTSSDDFAADAMLVDPLDELRKALEIMQNTWFKVWIGTWPTAIDWTRAVLDTYLVSALSSLSKALPSSQQQREIENEINLYFSQNVAYYFGENAFSLRNQAYDDMLWVVLGWLESVKFIKKHSQLHYQPADKDSQSPSWHGSQFIQAFAHRARVFYDITTRGWDTKFCGGGMTWNPSLGPYKNAITNELFIAASVDGMQQQDLGKATPQDPSYLEAAIDGYDWLKNSNMTNAQGLYVDGFHILNWRKNGTKCDERNNMVYTYNQGVLLSGLRGLWESTGNKMYLQDGHQLVRNVISTTGWLSETGKAPNSYIWAGLGRNGILEDACDASGHCDQNAQTFKGIFFHHLTLFCDPLPFVALVPGKTHVADKELAFLHRQSCKRYAHWVAHNAKAALSTRDEKGRFGMWWAPQSVDNVAPLPEGAIDYRTNAWEVLTPLWLSRSGPLWSDAIASYGNGQVLNANGRVRTATDPHEAGVMSDKSHEDSTMSSDPNDRGRGRTVETQGGGVAVLRALWELLNTP
ncbi:hypothetical protein LTR37_000290 [Vermiconidia calcicola]|uniref:Uncharacterized protein n=1 Tax=Vermiconidia calcicola TaxID=1690605 RepID=A0ACC3P1I8_9PEZI|nr:hypothetical protein LTR37_000290 [Vermiconidia calcicola]